MHILSLALGGCLRPPPLPLGLTEDSGGHLTYVWGAAAALARRSDVARVEIVTRRFDEPALGEEFALAEQRVGDKLLIRRIDSGNPRYLSKEAAVADRPAFTRALLADLARRERLPDVIHAHFADAAEVAIAVRQRFGIPFIYTAHSLGIDKADHAACDADLERRIGNEDRAVGGADAIIASSRDEAERQLMRYPSADAAIIHRVPPGASLDDGGEIGPERARRLLAPFLRDPERPIVLAIARPVRKKNLPLLVDLFAGSPELRERANLVIVAGLRDGPDSGEIEQREVIGQLLERLDAHDLYGRLALPKRHDQADIASLYALARETGGLFVNPAATEPYGLTLTEAARHGLPVVATCNGGAADIVSSMGHGRTADPADAAAFAEAMVDLLTDPQAWAEASRQGSTRARALSWDAYAARFRAIAGDLVRPAIADRPRHRLLLSDIDGTLTGCRSGAAALAQRLRRSDRPGFGVATGRSLQEARRLLAEWDYPEPDLWVTAVGTEIAWRRGGRLVSDRDFAAHIAQGWQPDRIVAALEGLPGLEPQPAVEQRRFKRSWFAEGPEVAAEVSRRLADAGLPARVIFSHDRLLDVLPERAGKGAAMRWVAARSGLPLSAVVAAGDSGNDRDMLEACPHGVLVANHCPSLADLAVSGRVYVARRPHAWGVIDGLDAHAAAGPTDLAA